MITVRTSQAHLCAGDPRRNHSANCHASLPWAVHNRLARTKALPQRKTPHQKVRADFARSSCIPSTAKSRLHHFAETSQFPRVRVVKDKPPPTTFQNVVPEAREGPRRGPRMLSRDCSALPPAGHPDRMSRGQPKIAKDEKLTPAIEGPQDPYHPVLPQGQHPREGLLRDHRARQEQGPARQGPRPPAHPDPQDHHPQDSLR